MAHRQAPGQYKEEPSHDSVSHILLRLHTFRVTNIALSTIPRKTWRVWEDAVVHDQCQASSDAVLRQSLHPNMPVAGASRCTRNIMSDLCARTAIVVTVVDVET